MIFKNLNNVYFIGVGGIGMSALARYFLAQGKNVLGYDKTSTALTDELQSEGVNIHFEDLGFQALKGLTPDDTVVIYTPAVPNSHAELTAFIDDDFMVIKRAKALGMITQFFETFAVAGTHGKTTTSSILMHVLNQSEDGCNAFIGGISSNYNSNCIINTESNRVVVEADEFDRSFLQLLPNHGIITSMDADHLDIYGDGAKLKEAFLEFMKLVKKDGVLMAATKVASAIATDDLPHLSTYGFGDTDDWKGSNITYEEGRFYFDIENESTKWDRIEFGLPGSHNAENALAVFATCSKLGIEESIIRDAFKSYSGVKRRFDFKIRREDLIYIDDYAHHPTEITAFINSVRKLYPEKKLTAIFQPHLFSRTRDFMDGFAESLALADQLILLDIYPARELPIGGITSEALLYKVDMDKKSMSSLSTIVHDLQADYHEVILTIGAGDIDTCVEQITKAYSG